jgi:hypothetical protein
MTNARPTVVDRALRPFAEVRAADGLTALLLGLNVFLILSASVTGDPWPRITSSTSRS